MTSAVCHDILTPSPHIINSNMFSSFLTPPLLENGDVIYGRPLIRFRSQHIHHNLSEIWSGALTRNELAGRSGTGYGPSYRSPGRHPGPGGRGGRDRAVRPAGGGGGQLELRNEEKSGSCQRLIVVQKWLALLIGSLSLPNFRCWIIFVIFSWLSRCLYRDLQKERSVG